MCSKIAFVQKKKQSFVEKNFTGMYPPPCPVSAVWELNPGPYACWANTTDYAPTLSFFSYFLHVQYFLKGKIIIFFLGKLEPQRSRQLCSHNCSFIWHSVNSCTFIIKRKIHGIFVCLSIYVMVSRTLEHTWTNNDFGIQSIQLH